LEINVLFLGIFTWEPDIWILTGPSFAVWRAKLSNLPSESRPKWRDNNKAVRGLRQAIKLADGGVTEKIG
jgi:hypothetical protein